jgi:putative heme-binding domain-containing protein
VKPIALLAALVSASGITALGASRKPEAGALIGAWCDRLLAGSAPPALALEITEAAKARGESALTARLERYRAQWQADDQLAPYRPALFGGDAERGRAIFTQHAAQCIRCHAVDGEGGNVGPDLRGVPNRLSRDKILESLIVPSAEIAPGYGVATITLKDGSTIAAGILAQSADELVLRLPTASSRPWRCPRWPGLQAGLADAADGGRS